MRPLRLVDQQVVMQLIVVVVVATSVLMGGSARGDECGPPSPGDKLTPPWECCDVAEGAVIPEALLTNIKKCREKLPLEKIEGPPKGPPSAEIKKTMTCMAECVFQESGALAADKTLDKKAVTKIFTTLAAGNKDWSPVVPKVLEKCFSSYSAEVDQTLECKSGAKEFEDCVMRELFLNCPKAAWSDKTGCDVLKAKVSKCTKVPIMLLKPKN